MSLDDDEIRHLAVSLFLAPTARDEQKRVGASNLSNGCDYCLASMLLGDAREVGLLQRLWGGSTIGTSIHNLLESRMTVAVKPEGTEFHEVRSEALAAIGRQFPNAQIEKRTIIGDLGSYGPIGSTPDLTLPDDGHIIDWKSSTRHKSAIMRDALGQTTFGRAHKDVKLSEAAYAKEIASALQKVTNYYGQTHLYGKAKAAEGIDVQRMSLVFVNRDGTGYYDHPAFDGYSDATKMRDVWVLSFSYDPNYAEALWERGIRIWEAIESGSKPDDFQRNDQCFACSVDGHAELPVAA